mgnify:CR=1 FL=1
MRREKKGSNITFIFSLNKKKMVDTLNYNRNLSYRLLISSVRDALSSCFGESKVGYFTRAMPKFIALKVADCRQKIL